MNHQSVIVYGGSGFLGRHTTDALSAAGYKVRIFDRSPPKELRPGQEMIAGDIQDLEAVKKAARGCDYVYNFAGIADIGEARERPLDTAKINIIGNTNCLEAAREAGAKRFVFASTVYVFSEKGSFYRASKQACERIVECYHESFGLDYTILRYGSLYGRGASEWNGIRRLLKQALEKKEIVYEGDEQSRREYIHVKDAARLSVDVLAEEYANRHIIITGRESMPVRSLLQMIAEMVPGNVKFRFATPNSDDTGHYVISPYAFNPKIGHKLVSNEHLDIGQGLLDCLGGLYEEIHRDQQPEGDLLIPKKKGS